MIATQVGVELESFDYYQDSETYRFEYDLDTTSPSLAIVAALSEVMDADPAMLEPLHDAIDADALDSLVNTRNAASGDVQITFALGDYTITVYSDSVVTIVPQERDRTVDPDEGVPRK